MALAGVGQHFSRNLDQYTIMCVFGSVVGCVVLPLMAQSLESLIITAILFGVTVKTLNKKPIVSGGGGTTGVREAQDERRKEKKGKKLSCKRHVQMQQQTPVDGTSLRQQREWDQRNREELRMEEKEQKEKEKRKKKAKKRVERLQRREEERLDKEKKEAFQLQLRKERDSHKKSKPPSSSDLPVEMGKLFRRERKHSTSSTASSASTYSTPTPNRRPPPGPPKRAASAPLITATSPVSLYCGMGHSSHQIIAGRPSLSACSSPSSCVPPRHHAPLQMLRVLPLLPFVSPRKPHPHFFYDSAPPLILPGSAPHVDIIRPHPLSGTGQVAVANSAQINIQPKQGKQDGRSSPVTADMALLERGRSLGEPPPDMPCSPPDFGSCGPAQGFYSFLNDQALNSDPISYPPSSASSSIWSPPSSLSVGEEQGEWPSWSKNSTQ